jgi:hypothetical protein
MLWEGQKQYIETFTQDVLSQTFQEFDGPTACVLGGMSSLLQLRSPCTLKSRYAELQEQETVT